MKICLVDYDFTAVGGVEKVLTNLANELSSFYDIYVLSICSSEDKPFYPLKENITVTILNREDDRIRKIILRSFSSAKKFFKENDIDLCLVLGHYPIPVILPVIPFVKAKFIYCDHGAIRNQWNDRKTTLFRRLAARFFDKVISLTQRNMNDYTTFFKTKASKLDYIYNYSDKPETSCEYNVLSKKIITVSRLSKEKGLDLLLETAGKVLPQYPDWTWDIYGDGEMMEELKAESELNGTASQLFFKGNTDELNKIYGDYAMYVMTSYREGLPVVLIEAKNHRLPIISFDCITGPSEIIDHDLNGFLIPCYDTEIMAEKISFLIENTEVRKNFSDNSYDNIEKFDKENILMKWRKIIDSFDSE